MRMKFKDKIVSFFNSAEYQHPSALFLHIHKTAGTSMLVPLRKYYEGSFISGVDYLGHPPDEFKETRFVSGHMGYEYAKHFMLNRFTFTFLRNPYERILSLYYYCRNRESNKSIINELCQQHSLSEFLAAGFEHPIIKLHIWNNQVWQLARGYIHKEEAEDAIAILNQYSEAALLNTAENHLMEFSYVGFTETFDDDMKNILAALNIKHPNTTVHNNKTAHPTYNDLSLNDRLAIDELTKLDWLLYNHAWNLRQQEPPSK